MLSRLGFSCIVILFTSFQIYGGDSRIELVTINSPALGVSKKFNIYLPVDYDENVDERYPVVYLFRGHEGEWANPFQDGSRRGNIKDVADELYDAGLTGKMILVMPGLSSTNGLFNTAGINMLAVELASDTTGLGSGQFEDYLLQDLMPYVDGNYRTFPLASQRGMDGFSAGGLPAIVLATKYPDLFSSAGAYSGFLWFPLGWENSSPGPRDNPRWSPYYGEPPRDIEYMKQFSPANLIDDAEGDRLEQLKNVQFLIHTAGPTHDTIISNGSLRTVNEHIVDLLAQRGIQNAFEDISLSARAEHKWFYADEHMRVTLPLHWQKFRNPVNTIPLKLITPAVGNELSGIVEIKWSPGVPVENITSTLEYTRDEGTSWSVLTTMTSSDTTYQWNTAGVPDGTRYLLRISITVDSLFAAIQTEGRFTINNPGNAIPDIELLSPESGDRIAGDWPIRWFAADADGDQLTSSMDYSTDNGVSWKTLFSNQQNSNEFLWNSRLMPNSRTFRLALMSSDDTVSATDTSVVFEVFNKRNAFPPSQVPHVSGKSGATITAQMVDQLTDDRYRITFNDTLFDSKVYDVLNVNTGEKIIENAMHKFDGITEGPIFDGIRLLIKDTDPAEVYLDSTGWTRGSSTLEAQISVPTINVGGELIQGVAYPADYKIILFDDIVDSTSSAFGNTPKPVKFEVWNLTENRKVEVTFFEFDNNQTISNFDNLKIIEPDEQGEPILTWQLFFTGNSIHVPPIPGDEFTFKTLKPLTGADVYEINTNLTSVSDHKSGISPEKISLFQNYPNPFNPTTRIPFDLPKDGEVSLKIFNVRGQVVRTLLYGTKNAGSHVVDWDGKDGTGRLVSSGAYFYQIRTDSGIRTLKMSFLK